MAKMGRGGWLDLLCSIPGGLGWGETLLARQVVVVVSTCLCVNSGDMQCVQNEGAGFVRLVAGLEGNSDT